MTNQTTLSSGRTVSFDGYGVPKLKFQFGSKPSLAMDLLITTLAENYPNYAHALVVGILYEKGSSAYSTFDMLNLIEEGVEAKQRMCNHGFEDQLVKTEGLVKAITQELNLELVRSETIQELALTVHKATSLFYKESELFYGLPSLTSVVSTQPQPVTTVTAVEIKPTETPAEVKPAVEPVEKPTEAEVVSEPKAKEQSVDDSIKNMLAGNEKFGVLIELLKVEVEAMIRGNIGYDEPLLAKLLSSKAGEILRNITLRDFSGDKTIPKKAEMTATFLLEKAGVETPTDAKRKDGESAFKILAESPMIFEAVKDQMSNIIGVEITKENLEEIFSKDVEISIGETFKLRETIFGTEEVKVEKVKAGFVDVAETSLASAMRTAFKKNQAHHAVKKAK